MAVDMTELEDLMRRSEAMKAEDEAIQRDFHALVARWMEGTPEERNLAQRALANWTEGARGSIKQAQAEMEMAQNWLIGG